MNGILSLMNETGDYARGQRITFVDRFGKKSTGKYVMASSADGYVVLNMGGRHGTPAVVAISSIIK